MSADYLSPAIRELERVIVSAFSEAQDKSADAIAAGWKGEIVELDVIDTGNYLQAVRVTDTVADGETRIVMVEAPEAGGYAAAIRRRGESDYVGRRVAEQGIGRADGAITQALERAGAQVRRGDAG